MSKQWIFPLAIPALILGVVVVLRIVGARKLRRMRQLTCPDCHTSFVVPSLAAARLWMDFDVATGKHTRSGFSLRCECCSADYRFTDSFQFVGRAEQKISV
jgi:RNase P subunit RPR2